MFWRGLSLAQTTAELIEDERPDHLSADEVRAMVMEISPADASDILKAARWFSARCGMPEEDLRQEALTRLLAGDRHIRRNFKFGREVGAVIQSIAWDEIEAIKAGRREVRPPPDGVSTPHLVDPSPSPEARVLSACDDGAVLARICQLIEGDEELQLLVEGICDRMRGEELQELLGVDAHGLAAARRRLKRRLQSEYPEGMGQ
jgi:hypothetical protein